MREYLFYCAYVVAVARKAVVDVHINFGDDLDALVFSQAIKRRSHRAFGVVFDRHDAIFGLAAIKFLKDRLDV